MQAFAFNIRRGKFQDPRVRRAFNFAFDFQKIDQELFYRQYTRISSYFDGTELASSGLPQGRELELLQAVRAGIPPEVFTTPYWNPVSEDEEAFRANLLHAMQLLFDAGLQIKDLRLVDPSYLPATARIWWPPPRLSTACSCGTTTSCRNGISTRCARHAGIGLLTGHTCRNTVRRHFRRSGGGMPGWRRSSPFEIPRYV
jgi:hypothetical protein